jgi:hypothetical protein
MDAVSEANSAGYFVNNKDVTIRCARPEHFETGELAPSFAAHQYGDTYDAAND